MSHLAVQPVVESTVTEALPIAVAVTDPAVRRRIISALADCDYFVVTTGEDAQQLVNSGATGELLICHWGKVTGDELALLADMNRENPDLLVVAVCDSVEPRHARRTMDGGVDGLVFTEAADTALLPTVRAVLAGQTVIPRRLTASMRKPSLSFREKQILGMVVLGFTNNEIGSRLFLAESTVKSHLSSAFGKLGVRSRSEAAALILDPEGSLATGILNITGQPTEPAGRLSARSK